MTPVHFWRDDVMRIWKVAYQSSMWWGWEVGLNQQRVFSALGPEVLGCDHLWQQCAGAAAEVCSQALPVLVECTSWSWPRLAGPFYNWIFLQEALWELWDTLHPTHWLWRQSNVRSICLNASLTMAKSHPATISIKLNLLLFQQVSCLSKLLLRN